MVDYKVPIVTGTSLTAGDVLRWSGSAWVNYPDSNYGGASGTFVDRGDPAAQDRAIGDLTNDGSYHDLDLGPNGLDIVPTGAKAILMKIFINGDAGDEATFRKNGNSNDKCRSRVKVMVNTVGIPADVIVACDTDGVIEYKLSNSPTALNIVVKGWWT